MAGPRCGVRGRGTAPEPEAPAPRTPRTVAEARVDAATAGVLLGLEMLNRIDLEAEFRRRLFTLQSAPTQLRGVMRSPPSCAPHKPPTSRRGTKP